MRLDNINFVNNSINASKNSALATAAGGSLAIVGDYGEIIMIKNSTFVGNSARFGGAISVTKGGIVYVNTSRFFSNTALEIGGAGSGGDGGIIYADGHSSKYVGTRNYYSNGFAKHFGGSIYGKNGASVSLHLSHIHSSMALIGGGVFVEDSCTAELIGTSIVASGCPHGKICKGGGLYAGDKAKVLMVDSTISRCGGEDFTHGGGLYMERNARVEATSIVIQGCLADFAGGIFVGGPLNAGNEFLKN